MKARSSCPISAASGCLRRLIAGNKLGQYKPSESPLKLIGATVPDTLEDFSLETGTCSSRLARFPEAMAKVTKLTFKLDDDGHHSALFGMPEFRPKMVVVDCADQPLAFDLFEELPAVEELVVMRASTFMFRMMPETLKKLQIVDPMWDLQIILESGMEEDALRQHLAQGPLATAEIFFWFQPGTRMPTVEHDFWTSLQNVKLYAKT